ncbi:MAG TPA: hypothetical protein VMQ56_18015 [Terracidiphilus sp.]|jgi:hypothetical protein|nr:hypothetical protein [Terracidiphilus sp.]
MGALTTAGQETGATILSLQNHAVMDLGATLFVPCGAGQRPRLAAFTALNAA